MQACKKYLIVAFVMLLAFSTAACNSKNTITTTYKPDGSKVVTQELSDESVFFVQQASAIENRKPVAELIAQDGKTIVLQGVKEFRVWGFDPQRGKIDQYENQWVKLLREWMPVAVGGATSVLVPYLSGQAYASVLEAAGGLVGPGITNSFNNSGANSPTTYDGNSTPTFNLDHSNHHNNSNSHNDNSQTDNSSQGDGE